MQPLFWRQRRAGLRVAWRWPPAHLGSLSRSVPFALLLLQDYTHHPTSHVPRPAVPPSHHSIIPSSHHPIIHHESQRPPIAVTIAVWAAAPSVPFQPGLASSRPRPKHIAPETQPSRSSRRPSSTCVFLPSNRCACATSRPVPRSPQWRLPTIPPSSTTSHPTAHTPILPT